MIMRDLGHYSDVLKVPRQAEIQTFIDNNSEFRSIPWKKIKDFLNAKVQKKRKSMNR